jgi:hypothetical protein
MNPYSQATEAEVITGFEKKEGFIHRYPYD